MWPLHLAAAMALPMMSLGCSDSGNSKDDSAVQSSSTNGSATRTVDVTWLTDVTEETGLHFTCKTGATDTYLLPHISCGGVGLIDYDNDDDLDVYFINGLPGRFDAPESGNRLFRQESPWHFVDVTEEAGLIGNGQGMGCAVGDIDNDGDVDLFVTNYEADQLFLNRGDGSFEDITVQAGVGVTGMSCSATFFDYDNDGYLDLYITQYVDFDPDKRCTDNSGRPEYCGPLEFPPVPDVLLHNNGNRTFTDVSRMSGIANVRGAGLGVVAADFNGDGWQDIYVANDAYDNHLWINQRDGTFVNDAMIFGLALNMHGQTEAGMGVVAADLDNDLDVDLFVTHLARETNTVYRNRGGALGFEDATGELGLANSSFPYTGFGVVAFDIELDGDLDLAIANGRVNRQTPPPTACAPEPWARYVEPNLIYTNTGGARFELAGDIGSPFTAPLATSRGLAAGDIDNDGDLDLVVNNIECPARILRNDAPRAGHWLTVKAVDPTFNRLGIGATVTVRGGAKSWIGRVDRGSSYLASSDPRTNFGLGDVTRVDSIEVRWSDGFREHFSGVAVDQFVTLERGTGSPANDSS